MPSTEDLAPQPPASYYASVRSDIFPLISHYRDLTTLDVGCGEGVTSALLREHCVAKTTLGIECSPRAAARASSVIDDLKVGDVETIDLSDWKGSVDLMLCLDVLEHLRDPWAAIKRLASCMKAGGRIVASIPNVQNKTVLFPLIRGRWEYEESGLLDRTHLRFFTHKTARKLIESGGFTIESDSFPSLGPKSKMLNAITFGALKDFLAVQFFIVGRLN